jgi:hypothetical protein
MEEKMSTLLLEVVSGRLYGVYENIWEKRVPFEVRKNTMGMEMVGAFPSKEAAIAFAEFKELPSLFPPLSAALFKYRPPTF